jgi:hypothetical protein
MSARKPGHSTAAKCKGFATVEVGACLARKHNDPANDGGVFVFRWVRV